MSSFKIFFFLSLSLLLFFHFFTSFFFFFTNHFFLILFSFPPSFFTPQHLRIHFFTQVTPIFFLNNSSTFGLPLTPKADACRTARHSLTLVATAKPATFITTMVREVARYNAMVQNAQAQQYQYSLHAAVLSRAKPEILRILQIVVEKAACDVVDHLSEVSAAWCFLLLC